MLQTSFICHSKCKNACGKTFNKLFETNSNGIIYEVNLVWILFKKIKKAAMGTLNYFKLPAPVSVTDQAS